MIIFQGEIRLIGIEVTSKTTQDFVIEAAEYSITDSSNVEIDSGFPDIDGHKISALFNATNKGGFYVIFKYHIGPEILKARVSVEVR